MTSMEQSVEEQVKQALGPVVHDLLATQQQLPDLDLVPVQAVVATAVSASGGQAEQRLPSMYPDLDQQAREILGQIGGTEDIIVVPDSINMSGENKAITLKDGKAESYRAMIAQETAKFPETDAAGLLERVRDNTILVKESLMNGDDLEMCGTIWHEHGHVRYEAAETGNVFAHELSMIHGQRQGDLDRWLNEIRPLRYLARFASEPGMDNLAATLQAILSAEEFLRYKKLRDNVESNAPVEKKDPVATTVTIEINQLVEGMLSDILTKAGLDADAEVTGELTAGSTVAFGGSTWKVESRYPDDSDADYDTFRMRRLT